MNGLLAPLVCLGLGMEPSSAPLPGEPVAQPSPAAAPEGPFVHQPVPPPRSREPEPPLEPLRFTVDVAPLLALGAVTEPSYRGFDEDRTWVGGGAMVRGAGRLGRSAFFLGGGLEYAGYRTRSLSFAGSFQTELVVHEPMLRVRAAAMLLEGLELFADLGGGPSFFRYEIDPGGGSPAAAGTAVTGAFSALAGPALWLPRRWMNTRHLGVGLELGFGYHFRGGVPLEPEPDLEDGGIRTEAVSWGDLDVRGFAFRGAILLRFL